jgi:hypothetical protein
LEAS